MFVYGFFNLPMSIIINTIVRIFTAFRYLNTRYLTTHYVFQVEVITNYCIT